MIDPFPAAVLVTMIAGLMPCTAAAQTGVAAAWTSCAPSPGQDLVLGTRTILWRDVTAPGPAEVRLGSRLPSRPPSPPSDPAARTDEPVVDPFERVFCAHALAPDLPDERASRALVLFVAAKERTDLSRVEESIEARRCDSPHRTGAAPLAQLLLYSTCSVRYRRSTHWPGGGVAERVSR